MADYVRGTVWADGSYLTAEDLNAEFDRIAALVNGGLDQDNFDGAAALQYPFIISAGDPRFQTGTLDNAELVAAAIAYAAASDLKLVFIPKTMFGYAGEAGFSPAMFDTSIGLVHEGGAWDGHDPIAYGAKPDDALVEDAYSIQACIDACATDAGLLPMVISFGTPGEYQIGVALTNVGPLVRFHGPFGTFTLDPGVPLTTTTITTDYTFAGAQAGTFWHLPAPYDPPLFDQYSDVASGLALASPGTISNTYVNILIDVPEETILRDIMARVRVQGDPWEERWAHGVGSLSGSNDDPYTGTPELTNTIDGVFTSPGSGAGLVNYHVRHTVSNPSGGALDWEVQIVLLVESIRRLHANVSA